MEEIPFVICGAQKTGKEQTLEFGPKESRKKLFLPNVTDSDISQIRKSQVQYLLHIFTQFPIN